MKTVRCRDLGFDCDHVVRAEDEEEVLAQAAEHALLEHGVEVTPEMAEQVRKLIHTES